MEQLKKDKITEALKKLEQKKRELQNEKIEMLKQIKADMK